MKMADLDDDAITVTLPADEGGAVITKIETEVGKTTSADDPISDLKGQFETLKGTLNNTTQRLVGAERELDTTRQQLEASKKEVTTSQLDTVLSGIQAAEADATSAEKDYVAAAEAGDFQAQARAQRRMAGAESRIQRLKEAEGDLKEQATTKPAARQETRQQPTVDPVERFTAGMSPKSAAWIRSHPDCVTDTKKNARMLAAHNLAMADDIPVDSDDYFARIEAGIAPKQAQQQQEAPKVNIRPSAPVAPSGNSSGGMNGGGQTVTLTRREAEAATDGSLVWNYDDKGGKFKKGDVIGVQEMARRKSIMTKEGHYNKSYTDGQ
jgi:hypothetical protein